MCESGLRLTKQSDSPFQVATRLLEVIHGRALIDAQTLQCKEPRQVACKPSMQAYIPARRSVALPTYCKLLPGLIIDSVICTTLHILHSIPEPPGWTSGQASQIHTHGKLQV